MKGKKRVIAVSITIVLLFATGLTCFAKTTQWCYKNGSGYKNYGSSRVVTGWNGKLTGIKNNIFKDDECQFTGSSYSKWLGGSPYNADKVTHYDIIEVKGTGSVSFSGGLGANASGIGVNMGISNTKSSKNCVYEYTSSKCWRVMVDYSYYAKIYSWSWMDLFTAASFKFGNKFVVVNSRMDNPSVTTGKIYYK